MVNSTDGETASIDVPSDISDYNLCFVVSNGSTTTTFDLVSTADESYTNTSTAINLTSTLTTGYFNKSITINGIVGQYVVETRKDPTDEESTLRYTTVYWTDITEIEVTGDVEDEDDNGRTPFVVKYASSDNGNYDYSAKSIVGNFFATNLLKSSAIYDLSR